MCRTVRPERLVDKFDNLLGQNASQLIAEDITADRLPQSLLFSGPENSGKLTCALELARVLSCQGSGEERGSWLCRCPSCLRHKALTHSELLVAGPRDCTLEIRAARRALLSAAASEAPYLTATRYLFVRSVRKLTSRFNPVFWEGEDTKLSKIVPVVSGIDELLEELDPLRPLPAGTALEKSADSLVTLCEKLENQSMYDSMPVSHIRRASVWAHLAPAGRVKVLVIENADRMQESVRNALLKILEEPPEHAVFVLTTSRRGAVMPTILSRLRTYAFIDRPQAVQQDVISRVFHEDGSLFDCLASYFSGFLPVSPEKLEKLSCRFVRRVLDSAIDEGLCPSAAIAWAAGQKDAGGEGMPSSVIVNEAENFEPRLLFRIFLTGIAKILRLSMRSPDAGNRDAQVASQWMKAVREAQEHVLVYNQSPLAALELLSSSMKDSLRAAG